MSIFKSRKVAKVGVRPAPSEPFALTRGAVVESPSIKNVGAKERPTAASVGGPPAYLSPGSTVKGKLHFETSARIEGEVEGEIDSEAVVTVGESAVLATQIVARSVVVSGQLTGDIVATQRVEIRASTRVVVNVTTSSLVIEGGAWFEGRCSMISDDREHSEVKVASRRA